MQSFTTCSVNITSVGRASDIIIASNGLFSRYCLSHLVQLMLLQSMLPLTSLLPLIDCSVDITDISSLVHYTIPLASVKKKKGKKKKKKEKKKKKKGWGWGVSHHLCRCPRFRSAALPQRPTEGDVRSSGPQEEMSDRRAHRRCLIVGPIGGNVRWQPLLCPLRRAILVNPRRAGIAQQVERPTKTQAQY